MELTSDAMAAYQKFLPSGTYDKLSVSLGIPAEKAKLALANAIPMIFKALQQKAKSLDGVRGVMSALQAGGFDRATVQLSGSDEINLHFNKGIEVLSRALDGNTEPLVGRIALTSGTNRQTASKILGIASAAVFAFISSRTPQGRMTSENVATVLVNESGLVVPDFEKTNIYFAHRRMWPALAVAVTLAFILVWFLAKTPVPKVIAPTREVQTIQSN